MNELISQTERSWDPYSVPGRPVDGLFEEKTCRYCGGAVEIGLVPTHTIFYQVCGWLSHLLGGYTKLDGSSVWKISLTPRYHLVQRCEHCEVAIVNTNVAMTMSEARQAFEIND